MSVLSPTRPTREAADDPASAPPRWHSLDVLKGLALWAMIAHHFQKWTGGDVSQRFVGFESFVVTDLAAPVFAVALGAAATAVGARVDSWADLRRPTWRWIQVLLLGLAVDFVMHGAIESRGVLPTLAILGLLVTLGAAAGVTQPWAWWGIAAACVLAAVPATQVAGDAAAWHLLNGPFSVPVYGVFAASGAAVAAHGLGGPERALPLARAAAGVLVGGLLAAVLVGGAVAPDGVWPPARYPGHLGFTLWGVVASFAVWGLVRRALPARSALGAAAARAGRRTLVVFGAHLIVRFALQQGGLLGDLDSRRWGLVTWVAVVAVCAASAAPRRRQPDERAPRRHASPSERPVLDRASTRAGVP